MIGAISPSALSSGSRSLVIARHLTLPDGQNFELKMGAGTSSPHVDSIACIPLTFSLGIQILDNIKVLDGNCFVFVGRLEHVSVPAIPKRVPTLILENQRTEETDL
jgi:hypothetical protein